MKKSPPKTPAAKTPVDPLLTNKSVRRVVNGVARRTIGNVPAKGSK